MAPAMPAGGPGRERRHAETAGRRAPMRAIMARRRSGRRHRPHRLPRYTGHHDAAPGDGKTVGRLRPFVRPAARYAFLPASAAAASSSATPAIAAST